MSYRCYILVGFFLSLTQGELFTSVQDLTEIFVVEKTVVDALTEYLIKTEAKLNNIKRYLDSYKEVLAEIDVVTREKQSSLANEEELEEKLAGNPLHAYKLIKRITVNWRSIKECNPQSDWKAVEASLQNAEDLEFSKFSDEHDLQGAAKGILRLQDIYQIEVKDLIQGNLLGEQTKAALTAEDCLYMGKHSFNLGMYNNSIEWFVKSHEFAGLENSPTITQNQVLMFMETAIQTREISQLLDSSNEELNQGIRSMSGRNFPNYSELCRGERLLDESYIASLKCYYDSRNSPYFAVMPAKVEMRYLDPPIMVFHDAISDQEIDTLKKLSKSQMTRSLLQGKGGKGKTTGDSRISKVSWLNRSDEMETLRNLYLRMSYLTKLSTDSTDGSAELMQVSNYGVGGHYAPHQDFLIADKTKEEMANFGEYDFSIGDRMATLMFYLSDVSRGGATVFPKLGVSLFPSKGSAVFWFNLKKSGAGDYKSLHGGCPVAYGSKWVTNKWIRERQQFRRRPCGLLEDD